MKIPLVGLTVPILRFDALEESISFHFTLKILHPLNDHLSRNFLGDNDLPRIRNISEDEPIFRQFAVDPGLHALMGMNQKFTQLMDTIDIQARL